jgi:hypothetical protein
MLLQARWALHARRLDAPPPRLTPRTAPPPPPVPSGLYRDAEKQLRSSLKQQDMLVTYLELVKVYLKLDLPNSALELLTEALK